MKNRRIRYFLLLFSVLLALLGISVGVYANGITTLDEIVTQNDFHLTTVQVMPFNDGSSLVDCSISGNLFSFTHATGDFGPYDTGAIVEWTLSTAPTGEQTGIISGSFVIDKNPDPSGAHGIIYISFTAAAHYVPLLDGETGPNYNFSGPFKITGGEGLYEGLMGGGIIAGTYQDHTYGPFDKAVDFVMMGKVRIPK